MLGKSEERRKKQMEEAIEAVAPEVEKVKGNRLKKELVKRRMVKEYLEVLSKVETGEMTFLDAEREVFGFNHAEIGEKVAVKWNLPETLVDAIGHHHTPELSNINPLLVSIVHIADAITMMMGIGLGLDGLAYNLSPIALERDRKSVV